MINVQEIIEKSERELIEETLKYYTSNTDSETDFKVV